MFKIVKSLFGGKETADQPEAKSSTPAAVPAPKAATPAAKAPAPAPAAPSPSAPAKAAAKPAPAPKPPTPEEICEIKPGMSKEQIRERLALLYRRYNRAASSLDGGLRAEAEKVLDAIVAVREKTFGPI